MELTSRDSHSRGGHSKQLEKWDGSPGTNFNRPASPNNQLIGTEQEMMFEMEKLDEALRFDSFTLSHRKFFSSSKSKEKYIHTHRSGLQSAGIGKTP